MKYTHTQMRDMVAFARANRSNAFDKLRVARQTTYSDVLVVLQRRVQP